MAKAIRVTFLGIIVVLVASLLLVACSQPAPAPTSTTPAPTAKPSPTSTPTPTSIPTPTATPTATTPVQKITLKFATYHAPGYWSWDLGYLAFKNAVEKNSGGRLGIDIYPSGQLAGTMELLNATSKGVADIGAIVNVYFPQQMVLEQVWSLPPLHTSSYQGSTWWHDLYQEYFKPGDDKLNIHQIGFWGLPPYWIITKSKQLNKLEDLKGFTFGSSSQIMTDLGVSLGMVPVNIPANDVYDALQKGTIDGRTAAASSVYSFKWHEPGNPGYFIDVGGLPASSTGFYVNKTRYDGLPADLKKIIDDAGWQFLGEAYTKGADLEETKAVDKMKAEKGTKIVIWTDAEIARLRTTYVNPLLDKWAKDTDAKGLPASKLLAAIKALAAKK